MKAIAVVVAVVLGTALLGQSGNSPGYSKDGKLLMPDYREWVFLSAGLGMSYVASAQPNANPSFDNVFVNPTAYQAFSKTGVWPDKSVLVLEVRHSDTKVSINKDGRVQTDIAAVEIHVKDSAHGGWAFYRFEKGSSEASLIPKTENCYSCHAQNGAVDTTFVQFYPTLIEVAKSKATYKTTEH